MTSEREARGETDTPTVTLAEFDFTHRAACTQVHDGDTAWVPYVELSATIRTYPDSGTHWLIRLAGIAARELADPGGPEARDALAALIAGHTVWLRGTRPDKYGNRLDAWIYLPDGTSVNDQLVTDGWAVPWNGQGQQPKPAWPRVPQQGVGHSVAAQTWKVGA